MKRIFADSFYFFALLNTNDARHEQALKYAQEFSGEIVLTPWIVTELGDGLARPSHRRLFLRLCEDLGQNPRVRIVPCADALLEAGKELYGNRLDKAWSLTDCISFVVMEDETIHEALTGDHHFEQAGFVALLK